MAELRRQRAALAVSKRRSDPDLIRAWAMTHASTTWRARSISFALVAQHGPTQRGRPGRRWAALTTTSDLPTAPHAEPWSEPYTEAHRAFIAAALDDPVLLGEFRPPHTGPAATGRGFDERVVEYPWLAAQRLGVSFSTPARSSTTLTS